MIARVGARLFTAVLPPEAVVAALEDFLEPRRDAEALRWTHAESWHLTTSFMADVAPHSEDALLENLAAVAARTPAFGVRLAGGGAFPHPDAAKHLWLGVAEGGDHLATLARRVRTAGERAGIATDGARFVPHLTLARANRRFSATRWLRVVDAAVLPGWVADELVLIESHLRDRGSRYQVRARLPLAGPDAGVRDPSPTTPPTA